jgi:hypothetical protein
MNQNSTRVLALFGLALPLMLLAGLRPVEATCGGGGGGGMGGGGSSSSESSGKGEASYTTAWVNSLSEATTKSTEWRKAVFLYFPPEGEKGSHPFFRTKMMQDISNEMGCLRIAYSKDNPLREELKVPKNLHVLHVCDWYANSLKAWGVSGKDKFNYPAIEALMKGLQKTVEGVLKKMEANLKAAEAKLEKSDSVEALKALGDLVTYRGHEIVARAKPAIQKIAEAAGTEIEAAVKIEDKKARAKELQKIKTRYKNLKSVEDRCDKEIEAATGMAPARETDSVLVRRDSEEIADALLASIDFSKRAPSISELAHQAMSDGLNFEIREENHKALEFYAKATGLDPKESNEMTYLGELNRHH